MSVLHRYVKKGEPNFIHFQISNHEKFARRIAYRLTILNENKKICRAFSGETALAPFQSRNFIFAVGFPKTGKYRIKACVTDERTAISSETEKNDYFYVVDLIYKKPGSVLASRCSVPFPIFLFTKKRMLKRILHPKARLKINGNFKYFLYGGNNIVELAV